MPVIFNNGGPNQQFLEWFELNQYYSTALNTKTTLALSADTTYFIPCKVAYNQPVQQLIVEVTTPAASGKVARLGIFTLQDGVMTRVVDAGAVLIDAAAVLTATISQVFTSTSRVFLAINPNAAVTVRAGNTSALSVDLGAASMSASNTTHFTKAGAVNTYDQTYSSLTQATSNTVANLSLRRTA